MIIIILYTYTPYRLVYRYRHMQLSTSILDRRKRIKENSWKRFEHASLTFSTSIWCMFKIEKKTSQGIYFVFHIVSLACVADFEKTFSRRMGKNRTENARFIYVYYIICCKYYIHTYRQVRVKWLVDCHRPYWISGKLRILCWIIISAITNSNLPLFLIFKRWQPEQSR